jgi:E3 ubiquitin-protein ligases UBR4 N-terminal
VQYNLFEVYAGKNDDTSESKDASSKQYFVCRDIEEAYTKQTSGGSKSDATDPPKPRFYNIASAEYSTQVCVIY